MIEEIKISRGDDIIVCKLKRSRQARRLRLSVRCDGQVTVVAPAGLAPGIVEQFIFGKIDWIANQLEKFKPFRSGILLKFGRRDYLKYKEKAGRLAKERLAYFNQFYNFKVGRVAIKNQKSRWGSCSKKGNLNFNYRIILLSPRLADYIIAHELCHLGELNHSKKFWRLVGRLIPDYKAIRKEIRKA